MKRTQLIKLLLLFSDYRFPVRGKSQRMLYLNQFSTNELQHMVDSKFKILQKLLQK